MIKLGLYRANLRPKRAGNMLERADFGTERADLWLERADSESARARLWLVRPGGCTYIWIDGRMDTLQDINPLGPLP